MTWRAYLNRAEQRLEIWDSALRKQVLTQMRTLMRVLRQPDFWISLVWILLAGGMLLGLAGFAIRHYDTFLRLKPALCNGALDNQRVLIIVFAAPLSLIFTLVATSEFLTLRQRQGLFSVGSGTFWAHAILMLISATALLWAMQC